MRNVNYKELGDRLLITIEAFHRHRSVQFILEERKRRIPLFFPVYEELFEQVGRSLWGLCIADDETRDDREARGDAAELLDLIRNWQANVEERIRKRAA